MQIIKTMLLNRKLSYLLFHLLDFLLRKSIFNLPHLNSLNSISLASQLESKNLSYGFEKARFCLVSAPLKPATIDT